MDNTHDDAIHSPHGSQAWSCDKGVLVRYSVCGTQGPDNEADLILRFVLRGQMVECKMNVVELSPDDITMQEAAARSGFCEKTLRRAVQRGQLPRRYTHSAHGPQLVFGLVDLDRWLAQRPHRPYGPGLRQHRPALAAEPSLAEIRRTVVHMQASLDNNHMAIMQLARQVQSQVNVLHEMQAAIALLATQLTSHDRSAVSQTA